MSLFLMSFPFLYIFNSLQSSLTVYILQSLPPVKETPEIETGMAEKSSWEQANIWQKLGYLVWRKNRKKFAKLSKTYFTYRFLPLNYFMFIILPQRTSLSYCTPHLHPSAAPPLPHPPPPSPPHPCLIASVKTQESNFRLERVSWVILQ